MTQKLSNIRAAQLVAQLLKANKPGSRETMEGVLGDETDPRSYAAAIRVLHHLACMTIVHPDRRQRPGDGTLTVSK